MHDIVSSVIQGFPVGCVFALIAVGFVLTYKVSRVFNLAFGAQAYASAAVYYELRVRHGWGTPPAALVAVLVFAPLLGLLLYWGLFRYLRAASEVARLAVSIGLLVALPQLVALALNFGPSPLYGVSGIVGHGDTIYHLGSYAFFRDDIATIVTTLAAVGGLTLMFRYTAIGLRMRAVVESSRMTELGGISSDRVSSTGWMLSSLLAGLAGVLLGPLYPQLSSQNFFVLVVVAVAAAAFAGLSSLPLALVGGLGLGIGAQLLARWLPTNSILAQGLRPSLPFVALFLVLVFKPSLQRKKELGDPLGGVDPPKQALMADLRGPMLQRATKVVGALVCAGGVIYLAYGADNYWLSLGTKAVIMAIIFLSFTVFTGMAGQVSLAQGAFAAIGAFACAQLGTNAGLPVLLAMLIGVVIAAAVGALLALPALRLGGIYLALATLAFAMFFENVIVKLSWAGGGALPVDVPRPLMGSIDFTSDRSFLFLCAALLLIVGVAVTRIGTGTTGRYLRALDSSELAGSSIGINPTRARIVAFAISGAIAGLGGGLLAMQEGSANYQADFPVMLALLWLVIVMAVGSQTVAGAIVAAAALEFFPELLRTLGVSPAWQFVLFGLAVIGFARHPEGAFEHQKRVALNGVQRLLDRRKGVQRQSSPPSSVETPSSPAEPAAMATAASGSH